MAAERPTYSLRFTQPRIRQLVRELAQREGISQNELLEVAAEHEVVARGALLADDLAAAAELLGSLTRRAQDEIVVASLEVAARGEALPDPIRARQITRPAHRGLEERALGAFRTARGTADPPTRRSTQAATPPASR